MQTTMTLGNDLKTLGNALLFGGTTLVFGGYFFLQVVVDGPSNIQHPTSYHNSFTMAGENTGYPPPRIPSQAVAATNVDNRKSIQQQVYYADNGKSIQQHIYYVGFFRSLRGMIIDH